jgi:hypothetical protein
MTLKELHTLANLLARFDNHYYSDTALETLGDVREKMREIERTPEGKAELLAEKVQECPID